MQKTKVQPKNWRKAKTKPKIVTIDTSADLGKLKKLENQGLIRIEKVNIENRMKKVRKIHPTVGILSYAHLPFRLGPYDNFDKIVSIIGKQNVSDAMILETHIYSQNDYFVTNNPNDFIRNGKREKLEKGFSGLKILTVDELKNIL